MRALEALAALLFLNAALSFDNWWPTPAVRPDHRLAPEFVVLWVILLVAAKRWGEPPRRLTTGLALGYLLLVIGRYLDVTAPALFGRPINLYWDVGQIPRFLSVAAQHFASWQLAGIAVLVVLRVVQVYHRVDVRVGRVVASEDLKVGHEQPQAEIPAPRVRVPG